MSKKFPIYIQRDQKDCGSSCIIMLCTYYGLHYSADEVRDLCKISKSGVLLGEISRILESFGFKTVGGFLNMDKLIHEAPLPMILHWEQDHFVVLYKIKKKGKKYTFFIADPAMGHLEYTQEEFECNWISTTRDNEPKGIVLLVSPENLIDSKNKSKETLDFTYIFSYFKKYKKYFFQLLVGLIVGSLIQLIFPFLTQSIVDVGIENSNINFIYTILLAQFSFLIGKMSIEFIRNWLLLHLSTRVNLSMVSDFFIKLMKLPMQFFDSKLLGDLIQRIDDHERIEQFFTTQFLKIIFSFFSVVVFGIVLYILNPLVCLIFILGSGLYALWLLIFKKRREAIDYKYFNQRSAAKNKTFQLINGMQEIKLQNCEQRKRWEWEDTQAGLFEINTQSLKLRQVQESGDLFINESKNIIITFVVALSVINGNMTIGAMLAIQYIIGQLTSPIEQIAQFIYDSQDASISLDRINEIRKKSDENSDRPVTAPVFTDKTLKIKNLSFCYDGTSRNVLNNINLEIPHGKTTAIVGSSGSGKTTLIKLLLQYYKIKEGEICIGDYNLNDINTNIYRSQCGTVMQDGFIFSDSIARNIAIHDDIIDEKRIKYAAELACISDFIENLALGYNTIIGDEGRGLSQGQKQRILIARTIYKNPDFIFFDEATNSLDATNERRITENLADFFINKTVILVAHRLSTVKNADQIIVLDNGCIVERGTHEELIKLKKNYFNLIKNQLELGE